MNSRFAIITFTDGGSGGQIDNTLPGKPEYPTGGPVLPPGGALLPVYPFDPTVPDNSLPGGGYPSTGPIVPGKKFIVKYLACSGLILVPDNTLPETPAPK